jgi:hypothetical protein
LDAIHKKFEETVIMDFVILAGSLILRFVLYASIGNDFFNERVELVTPLNSLKRCKSRIPLMMKLIVIFTM